MNISSPPEFLPRPGTPEHPIQRRRVERARHDLMPIRLRRHGSYRTVRQRLCNDE